ncbi:MAG TPA: peptide ABC transporter substrate-binding protein [Candidatus Didemnitutus sp.]|nr:peptide ABC transporter substrate-binding protein [Candidatus Didemnitutus sp.]
MEPDLRAGLKRNALENAPEGRIPPVRIFRSASFPLRIAALLAVLLGAIGCRRHESPPHVLRLSQLNEPATLDPQLATLPDEFFVIRSLSEGLVRPAPAGDPAGTDFLPAAASSWEVDSSGRQWVFHLNPAARWSNGDPVTASDFVATIRRALTPSLAAPKAALFFDVKNATAFYRGQVKDFSPVGAIARDDFTLEIDLEHPTPHLLALAASGPWIPVHAATLQKFGDTRESAWTRPGNFVGNGPFVLESWQHQEVIRVARNPHYHDASRVELDGIEFRKFDDQNTEERAYRTGQIDVTMTIPIARLDEYRAPERRTQPLAETRYLAINVTRAPLSDVHVRRALSLAVDRAALVTAVLRGGQKPARTFLPPGLAGLAAIPEASPDDATVRHARDLETARSLLAEAGYPGGRGLPALEISTWVNNPVLEAIQEMWKRDLGVSSTIVVREARVHAAALSSGDFTLGFVPAIPDYNDPSALLDELKSGAPGNYPHWSNARFDDLAESAARTGDPALRSQRFRDAEEILLEDQPVVPLYFNTQTFLVSSRVSGWKTDPFWTRTYLDLSVSP